MTLLADDRKSRDNLAMEDDLVRKIGTLESQVAAWIGQAETLHGNVDAGDRASILAHKADLVARLQALLS